MTDDAVYSGICAKYNPGLMPLSDIINKGVFIYKGTKNKEKSSYKFDLDNLEKNLFDLAVYTISDSDKDTLGTLADRNFSYVPEERQLSFNELSVLVDKAGLFYQWEKQAKHEAENPIPEDYRHLATYTESGEVILNKVAMADHLMQMFKIVSHTGGGDDGEEAGDDDPDLYVYDSKTGIFARDTSALCVEINRIGTAVGITGSYTAITKEIIHIIRFNEQTQEKNYPFNKGENLIPCLNGVIDIRSGKPELLPHSPDHKFTCRIPVKFDPEADPGSIDRMFNDYVTPDYVPYLYQIVAQAILQGFCSCNTFKTNYMIQGPADGGKSTLCDFLIGHFFSERFVSNVCLQDICGGSRFTDYDLPGKFLNIYDELSLKNLKDVGKFKRITGSYNHSVEKKGHQPKTAKIFCPHVFTCNKAPLMGDSEIKTDGAFWGRWVYIRFMNSDFERDPHFASKTFTPENTSGFLNKVLEMVVSIKNDPTKFKRMNADEVLSNWDASSDSLTAFLADCFIPVSESRSEAFEKGKFLKAYKDYIAIMGIRDAHNIPDNGIEKLSRCLFEVGFTDTRRAAKVDGKTKNSPHLYRAALSWNGFDGISDPTFKPDGFQRGFSE